MRGFSQFSSNFSVHFQPWWFQLDLLPLSSENYAIINDEARGLIVNTNSNVITDKVNLIFKFHFLKIIYCIYKNNNMCIFFPIPLGYHNNVY